MSVSINGTTGISGVNGSAATPAIQGGDANTGIFFGSDTAAITTEGVQRLEVDSNGRVGIGNTGAIPANTKIFVNGSDDAIVHRTSNSVGTTQLLFNHDDTNYGAVGLENTKLVFRNSADSSPTPRAYIDQNGVFLKGTDTSRTNLVTAAQFQVEGTGADTGSISLIRNGSGNAAYLQLASTGGNTIGSLTATPLASVLGQITFAGSDGSAFRGGAYFTVENDNASTDSPTAWSPGDCPARITMSTTPRGGNSPLLRFEIDSSGNSVIGNSTNRIKQGAPYYMKHPLEVASSDNSLEASGIFSNNGIGWYGSFLGGAADNSSTCAVQFEVYSSTTQSYPIMIYVIATGCNTNTANPAPVCGWRLFRARVFNGTIDTISQKDSGGDAITASIQQLNNLTYNGVANSACRFKVAVNTGRQESTATAWIDYRLATFRTDRLSG